MSPNEIATKIIERSKELAKHPAMLQDVLAKQIAQAITEERELLSRYLQFLNESIAVRPELVRHQLLMGSSRITTGNFVEEMHPEERKSYALRLNPVRRYYGG